MVSCSAAERHRGAAKVAAVCCPGALVLSCSDPGCSGFDPAQWKVDLCALVDKGGILREYMKAEGTLAFLASLKQRRCQHDARERLRGRNGAEMLLGGVAEEFMTIKVHGQ